MAEHDLAVGSFIEKWPHWLRWLLFIPASIIAPLLFLLIQSLFTGWFLDLGEDAFYFNLLRGVVYGAGIVLVGATVAPKQQGVVALVFMIIFSMLMGIALLEQFKNFELNAFLEEVIMLGAAGWATYYIFNETKEAPQSD